MTKFEEKRREKKRVLVWDACGQVCNLKKVGGVKQCLVRVLAVSYKSIIEQQHVFGKA